MKIPSINTIKTAEQAEELAIEWSNWEPEPQLSWQELADWSNFFSALADKFPELRDDFIENAII